MTQRKLREKIEISNKLEAESTLAEMANQACIRSNLFWRIQTKRVGKITKKNLAEKLKREPT